MRELVYNSETAFAAIEKIEKEYQATLQQFEKEKLL